MEHGDEYSESNTKLRVKSEQNGVIQMLGLACNLSKSRRAGLDSLAERMWTTKAFLLVKKHRHSSVHDKAVWWL